MGLLNMFKKKEKYGGMIKYLGLEEYWGNLSKEERNLIREVKSNDIDDPKKDIVSSSETATKFLWTSGMNLAGAKEYILAEKILLDGLKFNPNAVDAHFIYNSLIDLYYKQRDKEGFLEKCIEICKRDIELFEEFRKAYMEEERERYRQMVNFSPEEKDAYLKQAEDVVFNISIPSFVQLVKIYEKQERYLEAIEICNSAISYELKDGTKGGFEGRIEKFKKKVK